MNSVVELNMLQSNPRPRKRSFNPRVAVVSLFEEDEELVGFAKFLYQKHHIFTVVDWDRRAGNILNSFPLSGRARRKFLTRIGAPVDLSGTEAKILRFDPSRITGR